jgi:hypothetical protein
MAMIVPLSHYQRWCSRRQNHYTDLDSQMHTQTTTTTPTSRFISTESEVFHSDVEEEEEEEMDDVQTSAWIVVPTNYVSSSIRRSDVRGGALGSPITRSQRQKTMEKRRVSGLID